MHVSAPSVDLNWYLQIVLYTLLLAFAFIYLLKNTASKYFVVDAAFDPPNTNPSSPSLSSRHQHPMPGVAADSPGGRGRNDCCAVCAKPTISQCSGCKSVKYCSVSCQREHWNSEHQKKCKELQLLSKSNVKHVRPDRGISLMPSNGTNEVRKPVDKVLFPYDDFVSLFNWDKAKSPPCGLLNCGNSCYANVILQCLSHTRPLVAFLLQRGHRRECRRNEWCFFCELQCHIERANQSQEPFSPINILSRLPSIGGNLGYGRQEDAHEFMRFAIDTMQSICLDEHGGEKRIHPKSQDTTFIQHTFGGQLQSQVICAQCNKVSNQYENMMDLTVEIQGGATSLEECLDQFTVKEWLHGDNMYKCDGCNDYVKAWKRLTIRQAPNILTIALKRFQSGRFGKLNKRITFPESLDLTPYMSEEGDGTDKYKLYAVVVHIDMLNASFFGHYICYTKDSQGNWFRIDDSKVVMVELDEVLSQGAYMLLYKRVCARPTCLKTFEASRELHGEVDKNASEAKQNSRKEPLDLVLMEPIQSYSDSNSSANHIVSEPNGFLLPKESTSFADVEVRENGGTASIMSHSGTHHSNTEPSSLPVSRLIHVRESEAISVDHVNASVSALVSSPKEGQSPSVTNGFTSVDSSAPIYPSSSETNLVTCTSRSPVLCKQIPEEAKPEGIVQISSCNGGLDGKELKSISSHDDSINACKSNSICNGFGRLCDGDSNRTSLSGSPQNFENGLVDGETTFLWMNGPLGMDNGVSSCNTSNENGSGAYCSSLDASHSGFNHDQNDMCHDHMEVDAGETNGSVSLENGLTSSSCLDKTAGGGSGSGVVPSSIFVEPSGHLDDMDIDNGKLN